MSTILSFLTTLNSLSPLAVIALLALVLWRMAGAKEHLAATSEEVFTLRTNDIHELMDALERISAQLAVMAEGIRRIEARQMLSGQKSGGENL